MREWIILGALAGVCAACGPKGGEVAEPERKVEGGCSSNADCDAGLMCQGGMCLPYEGGAGDPCYDELDCEIGLDCKGGSCVERPGQ